MFQIPGVIANFAKCLRAQQHEVIVVIYTKFIVLHHTKALRTTLVCVKSVAKKV